MPEFLYGHWAVIEAMRSGRRKLVSLMIHDRAERRGTTGEAMSMADELNIPVQRVQRRILDDLANNGNHRAWYCAWVPFPTAMWKRSCRPPHDAVKSPSFCCLIC